MGRNGSPVLTNSTIAAISTLAFVVAIAIWNKWRTPPPPQPHSPVLSPAQAAYANNHNATATCIHLQPIERAMRLSDIEVRLLELSPYAPVIHATCRIDEAALRRRFALPPSINYREGFDPERTPYDHPRADIICDLCLQTDRAKCDISVLHPSHPDPAAPTFPA